MLRAPLRLRLAALLLGALALPALAGPPPEALVRDLGLGRASEDQAARAFAEAGLDPAGAAALVRGLGPAEPGPLGAQRLTLEDDHGATTDLEVIVPAAPRADGRYGLLVVLHGLRGDGDQLLEFGRRIAPPGTIVAAPTAQWLPLERENEDTSLLSQAVLGSPANAEGRAPRRQGLRVLAERAHRAAFPHWWSYQPDSFALRAVDAVRRRWAVDADRVLLCGYSMGGYGTWNVGLRYPDRFAAIAPLAGGLSRMETLQPRDDRSRALLGNARTLPAFVVHGDADNVVPTRFSRTITAELRGLGADVTYEEVPGGPHVMMPFLRGDERTARLAAWLAQRVRDPHPRAVEHHALGAYHGANYWVKIEAAGDAVAVVKAEVREGNRIVATTSGVRRLRLFLDPALVDVGAPVTVEVDGAVVHAGVVAPSLEAVASSFAGRGDPALVYERSVVVEPTGVEPRAVEPAPAPRDF